ncbi:hypothetical protein AB9P05_19605 [Roseivirga sp. BDSF3-8]|uniref:hypothetical protein n=1 Tax=Roseivirga sp. BDSF3-8 TaxID=3241598 RepID=UPI0035323D8B
MKFLKLFFVGAFIFGFASCGGNESSADKETMVGKDEDADNKTEVEFDANSDGGSLSVESEDTDVSISTGGEDDGTED